MAATTKEVKDDSVRRVCVRKLEDFKFNEELYMEMNDIYLVSDINRIFDDALFIKRKVLENAPKKFMTLLCKLYCIKGYSKVARKKATFVDFMMENEYRIFPLNDPLKK